MSYRAYMCKVAHCPRTFHTHDQLVKHVTKRHTGHLHQDVEVTAVSRPVDLHSRPVEIPAQRKDGEGEGEKKRKRRKKQSQRGPITRVIGSAKIGGGPDSSTFDGIVDLRSPSPPPTNSHTSDHNPTIREVARQIPAVSPDSTPEPDNGHVATLAIDSVSASTCMDPSFKSISTSNHFSLAPTSTPTSYKPPTWAIAPSPSPPTSRNSKAQTSMELDSSGEEEEEDELEDCIVVNPQGEGVSLHRNQSHDPDTEENISPTRPVSPSSMPDDENPFLTLGSSIGPKSMYRLRSIPVPRSPVIEEKISGDDEWVGNAFGPFAKFARKSLNEDDFDSFEKEEEAGVVHEVVHPTESRLAPTLTGICTTSPPDTPKPAPTSTNPLREPFSTSEQLDRLDNSGSEAINKLPTPRPQEAIITPHAVQTTSRLPPTPSNDHTPTEIIRGFQASHHQSQTTPSPKNPYKSTFHPTPPATNPSETQIQIPESGDCIHATLLTHLLQTHSNCNTPPLSPTLTLTPTHIRQITFPPTPTSPSPAQPKKSRIKMRNHVDRLQVLAERLLGVTDDYVAGISTGSDVDEREGQGNREGNGHGVGEGEAGREVVRELGRLWALQP